MKEKFLKILALVRQNSFYVFTGFLILIFIQNVMILSSLRENGSSSIYSTETLYSKISSIEDQVLDNSAKIIQINDDTDDLESGLSSLESGISTLSSNDYQIASSLSDIALQMSRIKREISYLGMR